MAVVEDASPRGDTTSLPRKLTSPPVAWLSMNVLSTTLSVSPAPVLTMPPPKSALPSAIVSPAIVTVTPAAGDVEDPAGMIAADGQLVRPRTLDGQALVDLQLAAGQRDGMDICRELDRVARARGGGDRRAVNEPGRCSSRLFVTVRVLSKVRSSRTSSRGTAALLGGVAPVCEPVTPSRPAASSPRTNRIKSSLESPVARRTIVAVAVPALGHTAQGTQGRDAGFLGIFNRTRLDRVAGRPRRPGAAPAAVRSRTPPMPPPRYETIREPPLAPDGETASQG